MKEKVKKEKIILILLLLFFIMAVGVGPYLWFQNRIDDTTKYWFDKTAKDGTLEGKSPEEIQDMLDKIVDEGMFNVSMNVQPVFQDGKSAGNLGIENIKENKYYCRVIITLDKDGSVLYESQGLKPGQYINDIKLKKVLPKGMHECTAQFIATDPDTLDDIGTINVKLKIVVRK